MFGSLPKKGEVNLARKRKDRVIHHRQGLPMLVDRDFLSKGQKNEELGEEEVISSHAGKE